MKHNLGRLPKSKLIWLDSHKCRHNHNYLEHYNCYLEENKEEGEKVGFIDIEASNLNANFGIMLSYCIGNKDDDKIISGVLEKDDFKGNDFDKTDKRIVKKCVEDMMKFDRLVGHYSTKFDMPFIRTRALVCGVEFPSFGAIYTDDTWRWAKNKLCLNSNRQDVVANTILGNTEKTRIDTKYWLGAARGDKKSLQYVLDHNKHDVTDIKKVWLKMREFINSTKTSI